MLYKLKNLLTNIPTLLHCYNRKTTTAGLRLGRSARKSTRVGGQNTKKLGRGPNNRKSLGGVNYKVFTTLITPNSQPTILNKRYRSKFKNVIE